MPKKYINHVDYLIITTFGRELENNLNYDFIIGELLVNQLLKLNITFDKIILNLENHHLHHAYNAFYFSGFKSAVTEKYAIDLEEDGAFIVKDKKTGERLKSKEKAGSFLSVSDVLLKEATEAGIIQKNPHAGAKFPKQNPFIVPIEQQTNSKLKSINPRFYTK